MRRVYQWSGSAVSFSLSTRPTRAQIFVALAPDPVNSCMLSCLLGERLLIGSALEVRCSTTTLRGAIVTSADPSSDFWLLRWCFRSRPLPLARFTLLQARHFYLWNALNHHIICTCQSDQGLQGCSTRRGDLHAMEARPSRYSTAPRSPFAHLLLLVRLAGHRPVCGLSALTLIRAIGHWTRRNDSSMPPF